MFRRRGGPPKLFDRKNGLIRAAGAELSDGEMSPETTEAIAAPDMTPEDYRRMTTLGFDGDLIGKSKNGRNRDKVNTGDGMMDTFKIGQPAIRAACIDHRSSSRRFRDI